MFHGAGCSPSPLQMIQGIPRLPQTHARKPVQGLLQCVPQTQPVSSQVLHLIGVQRLLPCDRLTSGNHEDLRCVFSVARGFERPPGAQMRLPVSRKWSSRQSGPWHLPKVRAGSAQLLARHFKIMQGGAPAGELEAEQIEF